MPSSVADVVVDELVAAGVARVFTAGPGSSLEPLTVAARARGLVVVETGASNTAAMMAAVTGELGETPGVLVLAPTDAVGAVAGLSYAGAARAPLLLICSGALEAVSA